MAYWKPVQSGIEEETDTQIVSRLVNDPSFTFLKESVVTQTPMSPHASAAIDGVSIKPDDLSLPSSDKPILAELAGGLMVPLNDDYNNIDWLKDMNAEVVLVSQYYLGSINHTLLSVEALRARGIRIKGIVFNGDTVPTTREVILHQTGLPCLLEIPTLENISPEIVAEYAAKLVG